MAWFLCRQYLVDPAREEASGIAAVILMLEHTGCFVFYVSFIRP